MSSNKTLLSSENNGKLTNKKCPSLKKNSLEFAKVALPAMLMTFRGSYSEVPPVDSGCSGNTLT